MATPRSTLVDEDVTPWYHCISRCVRRAHLCGEGDGDRKAWIEARIQELAAVFAIDCGGFAVLDNHLHLLLLLDSSRARGWSAEEVAERWLRLFPIRDIKGAALPGSRAWIEHLASDPAWVERIRKRLVDLSWFMKCLKEPLARMANKQDGCSGAFWEGRFKSIAVLDEESLLATAAYIDLNTIAAGVARTPEDSEHTSFRARIDHCRSTGTLEALCDEISTRTDNPEQQDGLWLLPTDDRQSREGDRPGLVAGCTLSCYVRLVDWTSRLIRQGKANLDAEAVSLFARLGVDPHAWEATLWEMARMSRQSGSHFGSAAKLADAARAHGRRWHRNQFRRVPQPLRPVA